MEDFLKNKLNDLESNFQDDWDVFEQKLERALFFRRLRVGAALAVCLIAVSIGIFGTSSIISFGDENEMPFGFITEEGYQSSGSQSEWKPQPANTIAAHKEEGQDLQDNSLRAGNSQISSGPAEGGTSNTALPKSSNQNSREPGVIAIATPNAASGDSGSISSIPNQSEVAAAEVEESASVAGETMMAATAANLAGDGSDDLMANAGDPLERASAEGLNTEALDEDETGDEQPSNLLELQLPDLDAMAAESGLAANGVRVPLPSFRGEAKNQGPYISPLEGKSPWEFSIKVYPNFTFRKFKVDEDKVNLIHRDFIDQVRISESGGFSLNIGLEISRRIAPATYLNSGVEYISYKTDANFDFTNFRTANIDENSGAITSYTLKGAPEKIVINDQNTYHYINVPFSIAYKPWASQHVRLNMEAGISYMYFVTARGTSIDYQTLEIIDLSEREFRNHMGSMQLKVGATYYISPQFNLGFEPTFVYFTNTIYTEEYPFEVIPYSVGLNLKLQVKLN